MNFAEVWDTKVSELAAACVPEKRLVELLGKDESYVPTEDEKKYLDEVGKMYKDPYGMFYISDMSWRIEHALADGRVFMAKLAITNVIATLDDKEYFQNVFGGDPENEEWKTRDALRKGLHELMDAPD